MGFSRLARALLVGSIVVLGVAACTVDVELGFPCTLDGKELAPGQTFPDAASPCNTCTCLDDGTISCTDRPCVCEQNGETVEIGGTIAQDRCNTCTCGPDLKLSCTAIDCVDCEAVPPDCQPAADPACANYPICDVTNNQWVCVASCECDGQNFPECEPPHEGCFLTGPLCVEGVWDCGEEICPKCTQQKRPQCPDENPDDNCVATAFCDGTQWVCGDVCTGTCPDDPGIECPKGPPDCEVTALCQSDGNIVCTENCPQRCMTEPPGCPDGSPACSFIPVCSPDIDDWVCVESCA